MRLELPACTKSFEIRVPRQKSRHTGKKRRRPLEWTPCTKRTIQFVPHKEVQGSRVSFRGPLLDSCNITPDMAINLAQNLDIRVCLDSLPINM